MTAFFQTDKLWPAQELETVSACPYCDCHDVAATHDDVKDWFYRTSAQSWTYRECAGCHSLYLSQRPAPAFIAKAYSNYYTHGNGGNNWHEALKMRIRNECYSQWLSVDITPRLHVPHFFSPLFKGAKGRIEQPFGLDVICSRTPGALLDVGCGSGKIMHLAKQLGWDVTGLEIDPVAVASARLAGLNVIEGDYRALGDLEQKYDMVICSHVIEHVDQPRLLLDLLTASVADGGALAIAFPNAESLLRKHYRKFWRGFEAPRHLSIPAASWIQKSMQARFVHVGQVMPKFDTRNESENLLTAIRDDGSEDSGWMNDAPIPENNQDLAGFICSSSALDISNTLITSGLAS